MSGTAPAQTSGTEPFHTAAHRETGIRPATHNTVRQTFVLITEQTLGTVHEHENSL